MLSIQHLSKWHGDHEVLKDIDFHMPAGTIVGLAGPSGGGKSTLLRCIQHLEPINAGVIHIKGQTGFMFQDFQLFPHMTVLKNLTYAPDSLTPQKDKHHHEAMALLARLGIASKAQVYPHQLSGGQKQRVALARTLMRKPNLLLCDEPTSGLDVATIDDVVALLKSVHEMGVTMLIASHDLDFLTKIASRVVVLKAGKIVFDKPINGLTDPISTLKAFYGEAPTND